MTSLSATHHTSPRFSTYSGAPSLHPSLAGTMQSTNEPSSHPVDSARNTMTSPPTDLKLSATTYDSALGRTNSTTSSNDARSLDLKSFAASFERMQDKRLDQQRFVPTSKKSDEISVNALGAKLERAMGRRMSGQDAIFTRRNPINEKPLSVAA